jgi:hypothetical protein
VAPFAVGIETALDGGVASPEGVSGAGASVRVRRAAEWATGLAPGRVARRAGTERTPDHARQRAGTPFRADPDAFVGLLLAEFALYYPLEDGRRFVVRLERMTPLPAGVRDEPFEAVEETTRTLLEGRVPAALVRGGVAGVALFLTGVPHAVSIAVAMTPLATVPVVGVSPVLGGAVVYPSLQVNAPPRGPSPSVGCRPSRSRAATCGPG